MPLGNGLPGRNGADGAGDAVVARDMHALPGGQLLSRRSHAEDGVRAGDVGQRWQRGDGVRPVEHLLLGPLRPEPRDHDEGSRVRGLRERDVHDRGQPGALRVLDDVRAGHVRAQRGDAELEPDVRGLRTRDVHDGGEPELMPGRGDVRGRNDADSAGDTDRAADVRVVRGRQLLPGRNRSGDGLRRRDVGRRP